MILCRLCKKYLEEKDFAISYVKRRVCRICAAEYNKKWRIENSEYDKERKRVYDKNHKEQKRDRDYRYDKKNKLKYLSRLKIRLGTRTRKIKRPNQCDMCGCFCKPDAHHDDYTKPLDVKWLCKQCHLKEHGGRFAA